MSRKNPPVDIITASIAPLLSYVFLAGIVYFFRKDIASWFGAGITGVSSEKFKENVRTISESTTGQKIQAVAGVLSFGLYDPSKITYTTQNKALLDRLQYAIGRGWIKQDELPYPTAVSFEQLKANAGYLQTKILKIKAAK